MVVNSYRAVLWDHYRSRQSSSFLEDPLRVHPREVLDNRSRNLQGSPALSDVSDNSELLWQLVLDESEAWYKGYLRLGPMDRLVAKPEPSSELADPKWGRVSRRIEKMILSAAPQVVRQEVSSARISGLQNVVRRLYCLDGPGGLAERELGLKNIQDPLAASTVQEAIDHLRQQRRRWCTRMSELGGPYQIVL